MKETHCLSRDYHYIKVWYINIEIPTKEHIVKLQVSILTFLSTMDPYSFTSDDDSDEFSCKPIQSQKYHNEIPTCDNTCQTPDKEKESYNLHLESSPVTANVSRSLDWNLITFLKNQVEDMKSQRDNAMLKVKV